MNDKKPCVLEGATPGHGTGVAHDSRPCASLCADVENNAPPAPTPPPGAVPAPAPTPSAPPEDESADPVGDGHSDADWAASHPPGR
jgi:hypothetical protein